MMIDFLWTSPVAEKVKLESNVVLHRKKLSAGELVNIEAEGHFRSKDNRDGEYELEVNGLSIARGTIIRKKGEYYFKVKEMNEEVSK